MAKVSKKVCKVRRIVKFEDGFSSNSNILLPSGGQLNKKDWQSLFKKELNLVKGVTLIHYQKEYPIVRYQPESLDCDSSFNTFIKSVTVSTGVHAQYLSISDQPRSAENMYETVFYYEDHYGIFHAILNDEICEFLLKKPYLTISPEGVLLFYTNREVLATVDCQHYSWLNDELFENNEGEINFINSNEEFCQIGIIINNIIEIYGFNLELNFLPSSPIQVAKKSILYRTLL